MHFKHTQTSVKEKVKWYWFPSIHIKQD